MPDPRAHTHAAKSAGPGRHWPLEPRRREPPPLDPQVRAAPGRAERHPPSCFEAAARAPLPEPPPQPWRAPLPLPPPSSSWAAAPSGPTGLLRGRRSAAAPSARIGVGAARSAFLRSTESQIRGQGHHIRVPPRRRAPDPRSSAAPSAGAGGRRGRALGPGPALSTTADSSAAASHPACRPPWLGREESWGEDRGDVLGGGEKIEIRVGGCGGVGGLLQIRREREDYSAAAVFQFL